MLVVMALAVGLVDPLWALAPEPGGRLSAGIAVRPPPAHVAFCRAHPGACVESAPETLSADPATLVTLAAVNVAVNRAIAPRREPPGRDVWSLDASVGDCDEYAVQKRQTLVARGVPAGALVLAVALTPQRERHLVLVARTQAGDLVLDNLTDAMLPVDRTGYRFLLMQNPTKPMGWAAVATEDAGAAQS